MNPNNNSILILGLGNVLLGDEGLGVRAAEALLEQDLGEGVEVVDGGTSALDVLLSRQPGYRLVVIDAVRGGGEPGTVYKSRLGRDDLAAVRLPGGVSLHDMGLFEALAAAERLERLPEEVVITGVEPLRMEPSLELSEQVRRSLPSLINSVIEETKNAVYDKQAT
jgi:hydrogenase maturation protease